MSKPSSSVTPHNLTHRPNRVAVLRRIEVVRFLIEELGPQLRRALDIGTGDGEVLHALQQSFPKIQFMGIESSPKWSEARAKGVVVSEGDARHLQFEDGGMDLVLLCASLKHVPDAKAVLKECRRVLATNGNLILCDPTPLGIRFGLLLGHFDPRWLHHRWSLDDACANVNAAGFETLKAFRYMLCPFPFPGMRTAEACLAKLGLSGLFFQQALLAKKVSSAHGL